MLYQIVKVATSRAFGNRAKECHCEARLERAVAISGTRPDLEIASRSVSLPEVAFGSAQDRRAEELAMTVAKQSSYFLSFAMKWVRAFATLGAMMALQ